MVGGIIIVVVFVVVFVIVDVLIIVIVFVKLNCLVVNVDLL